MALSTSVDGGVTWQYYATLDNGTATKAEASDTYPTVIVSADQQELLTVWSTYCPRGPAARAAHAARAGRADGRRRAGAVGGSERGTGGEISTDSERGTGGESSTGSESGTGGDHTGEGGRAAAAAADADLIEPCYSTIKLARTRAPFVH